MRRFAALAATLLLLALLPAPAHSQATGLRGKFVDVTTRAAVPDVQLKLTSMADTAEVHRLTAKEDGTFALTGLGIHSYRLEATRLGYAPLRQIIRVTKADQEAGLLALTPESVPITGITVTESPAPAIQKEDTTEFRASAVKVHKDANAEDLVQKMPGVTLENGQVKAQGENVQNVLVNGRPFFGSDPAAAMRNLPADVVDRVQVYDRMSDQSEFSGFDDGQAQKTMNFILRDQKSTFGKVYAGGGDQELYQAGGNATLLRGVTRLTLIGMSNNVNQKNFSSQDLFGSMGGGQGGGGQRMMMMGGGGRGGGGPQIQRMGGGSFDAGNFLVGQQAGISTTSSGGANYAGQWGRKLQVTASLFANDTDTDNTQTLARQYVPVQDSLALYDQAGESANRNGNQRFDARFEWTPDSLNSVIFAPRLYFQQSEVTTDADALNTSIAGGTMSAATGITSEEIDGNNLSGRLTLRHRFGKRGRNISADLNSGSTVRDGASQQNSLTESYLGTTVSSDTLDQLTDTHTLTRSMSARLAYTEPLGKGWQGQLIYNPSLTKSGSDTRAQQLDPVSGGYSSLDSALSNSYSNRNTLQSAGLAMLHTSGPWKLLLNASYQNRHLYSEQTFPATQVVDHTFDDILPSATLTGTFKNRRNLRLAWTTNTNAPSIGQLQNVVNNSNPLSLTSGNPDLRPTYGHTLSLRISEADPMRSRSRFVFANVTRTAHPIGNAIFVAPVDTVVRGIFLARGTQLTVPENLDESWNANLFGVVSRPAKWMKSIVSLNSGGSFTRTPTRVDRDLSVANTLAIRAGTTVASNVSQNLDFSVSYQGTYNISRNSIGASTREDYYTHTLGARFNWVVGRGIVIRQEMNQSVQTGVPDEYEQNSVLWNSTFGKKFLKSERGELRLTTTDVLAENQSVVRSVTETYIQDARDLVLGRYTQLVFTYTFK